MDSLLESLLEEHGDTFDLTAWVNEAFRHHLGAHIGPDNTAKKSSTAATTTNDEEQALSSLTVRMQLMAQELDQDIEAVMDGMVETLPNAATQLDTINLRLQSLQGRFEELSDTSTMLERGHDGERTTTTPRTLDAEGDTTTEQQPGEDGRDYAKQLRYLHTLKKRVSNSRELLQHAVTWERHIRDMEDVFASEDIQRMAAYLQVLNSATKTLGPLVEDLPLPSGIRAANAHEQVLNFAQQRFEESIEPVLNTALNSNDEEALKSLVKAFLQLRRLPQLIQQISRTRASPVSNSLLQQFSGHPSNEESEKLRLSNTEKSTVKEWGISSADQLAEKVIQFCSDSPVYACPAVEKTWILQSMLAVTPAPIKAMCFYKRFLMESGILHEHADQHGDLENSPSWCSQLGVALTLHECLNLHSSEGSSHLPEWAQEYIGTHMIPITALCKDQHLQAFADSFLEAAKRSMSGIASTATAHSSTMQGLTDKEGQMITVDGHSVAEFHTLLTTLAVSGVLSCLLASSKKPNLNGNTSVTDEEFCLLATTVVLARIPLQFIFDRTEYLAGEATTLLRVIDRCAEGISEADFNVEDVLTELDRMIFRVGNVSNHASINPVEALATGTVEELCLRIQHHAYKAMEYMDTDKYTESAACTLPNRKTDQSSKTNDDDSDEWLGSSDEEEDARRRRSRTNTGDMEGYDNASAWTQTKESLFSCLDAHGKASKVVRQISRRIHDYCCGLVSQSTLQYKNVSKPGMKEPTARQTCDVALKKLSEGNEGDEIIQRALDFVWSVSHAFSVECQKDKFAQVRDKVNDYAEYVDSFQNTVKEQLSSSFWSVITSMYNAYVVPPTQICRSATGSSPASTRDMYSVQPSDYVVQLGEFFMNSVQTLEPSRLSTKVLFYEFESSILLELGCEDLLFAWTNNGIKGTSNFSLLKELMIRCRPFSPIENSAKDDLRKLNEGNHDANATNSLLSAAFSRLLIASIARGITSSIIHCLMDSSWISKFSVKQLLSDLGTFSCLYAMDN